MTTRSILLIATMLAGCSAAPAPPTQGLVAGEPVPATTTMSCDGPPFDVWATDATLEMVAILEQVVTSECGRRSDIDPVCSALFLVAATDPVVAVSLGFAPDLVDRMVSLHLEALHGAVRRARQQPDAALAIALEAVIELDIGAALGSDRTLAAAVVARGAPAIVEPIRRAEDGCR